MIWFVTAAAYGFCGSYVGPAGDVPANGSSRVIVAYDGQDTTVTMTADAREVPKEFGMLVPVPADTDEDDVRVIEDLKWLEELDRFTAPRLVSYTCETLANPPPSNASGNGCNTSGCADAAFDAALDQALEYGLDALQAEVPGVDLLGFFTEGDLDVSILDPSNRDALQSWLEANGYGSVNGADALLDNYIEQDVNFIAVKASMPVVGRDAWLDPVQITYRNTKTQMLPLQLGSLNAVNDQELTMWVLAPESDGEARITTFKEVEMENECMPDKGEDVLDVFEESFDRAVGNRDGAWVTEFSWPTSVHCDPCAADAVDPGPFVVELGGPDGNAHITRMRMRFDPLALDSDLTFQYTNTNPTKQLVFIEHLNELEGDFPICFDGFADPPRGTCEDQWTETSTATLPPWGLLWIPLMGWSLRRRSSNVG